MIDLKNLVNYNRSISELEEFLIFCLASANKSDTAMQVYKVNKFLEPARIHNLTPFQYISLLVENETLTSKLYEVRLGEYYRLTKCLSSCVSLDLVNIELEELEAVIGIGPKTSRLFMINCRKSNNSVILDINTLTKIKENNPNVLVPKSTPQAIERYRMLEQLYLNIPLT